MLLRYFQGNLLDSIFRSFPCFINRYSDTVSFYSQRNCAFAAEQVSLDS